MLLEVGYEQTTFEKIAQRAGTTRTAIYARFPDKPTLYARVFAYVAQEVCATDVVDLHDELPLRASLAELATGILAQASDPVWSMLYQIGLGHVWHHPEMVATTRMIWRYYVDQITRYFENRIARGKLRLTAPERSAEMLAQMFLGPMHVSVIYGEAPPSMAERHEHIERVILLFLGGIGRFEIEAD